MKSQYAVVCRAIAPGADGHRGRIAAAVCGAGQGRNEIFPDLEGWVNKETFGGACFASGKKLQRPRRSLVYHPDAGAHVRPHAPCKQGTSSNWRAGLSVPMRQLPPKTADVRPVDLAVKSFVRLGRVERQSVFSGSLHSAIAERSSLRSSEMENSTGLLGVNTNLIDPKDARSKIVMSCARSWFGKNASGLHNWGDCSGFVKAVQVDLGLRPFRGQANDIFDEVDARSDWLVFGNGSQALAQAGAAANAGILTIGVWQYRPLPEGGQVGWARKVGSGHVAIITAYLAMLGSAPEQHAIGGWGQLHSVGHLLGKMSQSFGKDKHSQIRYAKCLTPVF
jgi:hypothetical protein